MANTTPVRHGFDTLIEVSMPPRLYYTVFACISCLCIFKYALCVCVCTWAHSSLCCAIMLLLETVNVSWLKTYVTDAAGNF